MPEIATSLAPVTLGQRRLTTALPDAESDCDEAPTSRWLDRCASAEKDVKALEAIALAARASANSVIRSIVWTTKLWSMPW
jgi:hypothetical protein